MTFARRRISLSPAARDFLLAEFRAIARASNTSIRNRGDRIAVTFRPRRQGRDAIPDRPVPIEDFRLLCLSHRFRVDARRGPRWRVVLGIHQAVLDIPGSGRVRFRCEQALDVTDPRPWADRTPNLTAARAAVVTHQAIQDADDRDLATGLQFPAFFFGFDPGRPPRFEPGDLPAAEDGELAIDGLRAWPAEFFSGFR